MLSVKQGISSTIFKVFGMTRPGIEPRSSRAIGEHSNRWAKSCVRLSKASWITCFYWYFYYRRYIIDNSPWNAFSFFRRTRSLKISQALEENNLVLWKVLVNPNNCCIAMKKNIPLTLFERIVCGRELETEQNCNTLTPTLMTISVSFQVSWAAQPGAWGPASLGAGFLYRILSLTGLVSKLIEFSVHWVI